MWWVVWSPEAGTPRSSTNSASSPGTRVIDKCRYDACLGTSLDLLLNGFGVDEISIGGVVANVCVEPTPRAAYMRDYRVTLLADACAARTERLHLAALEVISAVQFATVRTRADGFAFPPR